MAGGHNIPRIRVRPRELQHMPVKLRRTGSAADELADNQSQTQKYDFKDGKTYGIIAMDFVPEDVCRNIYMTNSAIMTETPNAATEYSERTSFTFLGRTFFVLRSLLFGIVHAVSFIANLFYR